MPQVNAFDNRIAATSSAAAAGDAVCAARQEFASVGAPEFRGTGGMHAQAKFGLSCSRSNLLR